MLRKRGYPNRLGVRGWAVGGSWGPERYLYTLHRITGLGILTYFLMHIFVTSRRALGQGPWDEVMGFFKNTHVLGIPVFVLGEFFVYLAFAFHAVNGIRLFMIEMGWGVGKPIEPIYPYATSVGGQRPLAIAALAVAAVLALMGGFNLIGGGH
jgi:succinate dehydrogenase / fumarate reductase cytochrome b subunit